ncbi:ABC transporter permease, partial [Rhodoblastus sp.]
MIRLISILLFLALWQVGAWLLGPHYLPDPAAVVQTMIAEARSGALAYHLGITLARVFAGFSLAMIAGSALGVALGRLPWLDRLVDPWVVILLNTPALVVIMFAYIWGGLNEFSALAAITLNKLPNAVVTLREGARALDPALDEMAQVFAFSRWRRWRHVVAP